MDALTNILFQYYQKEVPKTPLMPTQAEAVGKSPDLIKAVPVSGIGIDISALGRQVNSLSQTLTGDESAKSGLRSLVTEIAKSSGQNQSVGMLLSLKTLQTQDQETVKSVFSTVSDLAKTGGKVSSFVKTLASIENTEDQKAFSSSIKSILSTEGTQAEQRQTVQKTIETVQDLTSKTNGETESSFLNKLFQGLNEADTLTAKNQFLDQFQVKNNPAILA